MDGTIPPLDVLVQLKNKFGFVLYVDEAHSFGAIGKTGRGCLELWNDLHPQNPVPVDVIDIRSAVLSKAVGGLGGFVCATARFNDRLRKRSEELQKRGESLTTSTMLQTMRLLLQPLRLSRQLHRLRDISRFCHEELDRQGVRVYGDAYVPMLPVYCGRPSKACELSYVLRKLGLVASPVSAPAVEIWESRVRVTLSAAYSDEDVNRLIDAIVDASQQIGISRPSKLVRRVYRYTEDRNGTPKLQKESQEAQQYLDGLLRQQVEQLSVNRTHTMSLFEANCGRSIIEAGHAARQQFGLGSGSARWILGTFPPHLDVEELTARLTQLPSAMTYPDSDLGLMSSVAGLCRPIIGCKKHYFLIPAILCSSAEEGLRVASKNSGTVCIRYADHDALVLLFGALTGRKDTYITLYLDTVIDGHHIDHSDLAARLEAYKGVVRGITIFINDVNGLEPHNSPLWFDIATLSKRLSARILVSGSFYRALGLPGGYLAGDATLIEELRYTSRCYMFTTSPQPFVMAMIKEVLQARVREAATVSDIELTDTSISRKIKIANLQPSLGLRVVPWLLVISLIIGLLAWLFGSLSGLVTILVVIGSTNWLMTTTYCPTFTDLVKNRCLSRGPPPKTLPAAAGYGRLGPRQPASKPTLRWDRESSWLRGSRILGTRSLGAAQQWSSVAQAGLAAGAISNQAARQEILERWR